MDFSIQIPMRPSLTDPAARVTDGPRLGSTICRFEHFRTDWYARWAPVAERDLPCGFAGAGAYRPRPPSDGGPTYHRKAWEWCAVAQALWERGKLVPGARGLGFAVGSEPMASLFASFGVDVEATDLNPVLGRSEVWSSSGQHAASLDALYKPYAVDRATFDANVRFRYADMGGEWDFPEESYDFVWSCCAMEHLGSLYEGAVFLARSARLLKPGGIAVHTTEYNVGSNVETEEKGPSVIYRRIDIEHMDHVLRREGRCLAKMDFDPGEHEYDRLYDVPPYFTIPGRQHVKLLLGGYVATSFLLIVVN